MAWEVEEHVKEALQTATDPGGAPPNTVFDPEAACSEVLQWGHASRLPCHPSVSRTLHLLCQRFWWPSMPHDTRTFVAAILSAPMGSPPPAFLRSTSASLHPSASLVPRHPGLLPSEGNTVIMTIVDWFSKTIHFVPLPGLPSAAEIRRLMVQHVFRPDGILWDIVLDRNSSPGSGRPSAQRFWQR